MSIVMQDFICVKKEYLFSWVLYGLDRDFYEGFIFYFVFERELVKCIYVLFLGDRNSFGFKFLYIIVLLCIIMVDEKNKCLGGFVIVMVVWSDIFLYIFLYRCLCLYLRVFILYY